MSAGRFEQTLSVRERFEQKFTRGDGCWEWTAGRHKYGYGKFSVGHSTVGAHKVAYELYVGLIPQGMHVCHTCDNPPCVRPDHLFLGTAQDNAQDCIRKGRKVVMADELAPGAKLTAAEVMLIRSMLNAKVPQRDIANRFNVDPSTISLISTRQTWKGAAP